MAVKQAEVNPFEHRPLGRRVADAARFVARLPVNAYYGYSGWSRPMRRSVMGLGILTAIFVLFVAGRFYLRKSDENAINKEWVLIESEFRNRGDAETIIGGLDRILAISPNDIRARKCKTALETGIGDPSDPPTMMLLYRKYQRANQPDALIREARRRLEYEPRDYYAHYLIASAKLQQKDVAGAGPHLKALGNPEGYSQSLQFDAIAWALQTLGQAGHDVSRLRAFTSQHVAKMIQADHIANAEPAAQAMMLYLFSETFELPKLPPDTWTAWPAARKVSELCYDGAKENGDVGTMGRLALIGPRFVDAVVKMNAAKQIQEKQLQPLAAEVEDRTRRAWQFVIEKQPKTPEAYNGLMLSYARTGNGREAIDALMQGLEVCGDNPLLLNQFSRISILNDKQLMGYTRLKQAAERNPDFPRYWVIAAEAAYAGGARDLAIDALDKAHQAMPNDLDVVCLQAAYLTGTGYPALVLKHLAQIPDEQLLRNPHASLLFSRALAEIGDEERLDYFLEQALAFGKQTNDPRSALLAASGLYEATPPTAERAAKMAEFLEPIVERWKIEFPVAMQLQAAALVRLCELKPWPIDPVLARNAIIACEKSLAVQPNHLPTNTSLVFLRLYGDKDPFKALSDAQPLSDAMNQLVPEQAEVLGLAFNANKKYDEAVRALKPQTQLRATAGCWTQLAVAYLGQGRTDDAQAALDSAARLSKSDREQQEYLRARELLTRVKP